MLGASIFFLLIERIAGLPLNAAGG